MLFSATMIKNYDLFIDKELIFGEEKKESEIVQCGEVEDSN